MGYIRNIADKASLDLYGKCFWTRQEGDSVTLSTNDPVWFRDEDSHRPHLGGRYSRAVNDRVSPYVSAAYEHAFDGAIDAPVAVATEGILPYGKIAHAARCVVTAERCC